MSFLDIFRKKKSVAPDEKKTYKNSLKLGLALGSGGAKGFAHIGVLKAFEEQGIEFDYIAGASAGSIVGGLYACGYSVEQMLTFAADFSMKDIKTGLLPFAINPITIELAVKRFMGDLKFSDLKRPFKCVAVDLVSGEEIVLDDGSVPKAISASCAVPPVFKPVIMGEMHLIDGAYANPIPADVVRAMGAEKVVCVEVNEVRSRGTSSLNIFDVVAAANRVATRANAREGIYNSDVIIYPDTARFSSAKLETANEMMKIGYDAAMEKMEEVRTLIGLSSAVKNVKNGGAPTIEFKKKS